MTARTFLWVGIVLLSLASGTAVGEDEPVPDICIRDGQVIIGPDCHTEPEGSGPEVCVYHMEPQLC